MKNSENEKPEDLKSTNSVKEKSKKLYETKTKEMANSLDAAEKAELYEKLIVQDVTEDFLNRQEERRRIEAQWQLNMKFLSGNQYCSINNNGEILSYNRRFFWQQQESYNHIAPIIERRLSKLQKVRPKINVYPASNNDADIKTAKLSKKILESIYNKIELSSIITEATKWSEICGTSFYKIIWDSSKGEKIAQLDNGEAIKSGDVEILPISPFEIYPENSMAQDIQNCRSIIHARAYHADEIKNQWGIDIEGDKINILTLENNVGELSQVGATTQSNMRNSGANGIVRENYVVVIEKYEAPSEKFPNGRLIIVAKNKLLHIGALPFINDIDGARTFPFIKQVSIPQVGCFWGSSIIERLIPLQRAYNAIKNRKHEFLNRLSMGILTVEDGSIDTESLEEDGLCPGKVLVYRQGANVPKYMSNDTIPFDFTSEEESLKKEFVEMSGVSDFASTQYTSKNLSGAALELLIEQDENKILVTVDSIKSAIREIAKHILRLYKQYVKIPKLTKIVGDNGELEIFYFNSADISSDDIVFETKDEISETYSQRRNMVMELLRSGLLSDENGKLSNRMKSKVLELLGFGIWEGALDINELQAGRASKENYSFLEKQVSKTSEIDDHEIHISEHTAFLLSGEVEKNEKSKQEIMKNILEHIKQHKTLLNKFK
ncbi:MAG: hypothetical protein PHO06_00180 [Clostridia bacterium]|nr:hypothetical protein [Clostridia bacterium]